MITNRNTILDDLKQFGDVKFITKSLKKNPEFIIEACKINGEAIVLISKDLIKNELFMGNLIFRHLKDHILEKRKIIYYMHCSHHEVLKEIKLPIKDINKTFDIHFRFTP